MKLQQAANYFTLTPVDTWDGSVWTSASTKVTFTTYDRFISEREFGNKRRHILVDPNNPFPANTYAIRFPNAGLTYLLGWQVKDIQESEYSYIYLIHQAQYSGTLTSLSKTTAASGVSSIITRTSDGVYPCDAENITLSASKETPNIKFGDAHVILPMCCDVTTGHEVLIGTTYYEVQEVFESAGFRYARSLARRTP